MCVCVSRSGKTTPGGKYRKNSRKLSSSQVKHDDRLELCINCGMSWRVSVRKVWKIQLSGWYRWREKGRNILWQCGHSSPWFVCSGGDIFIETGSPRRWEVKILDLVWLEACGRYYLWLAHFHPLWPSGGASYRLSTGKGSSTSLWLRSLTSLFFIYILRFRGI